MYDEFENVFTYINNVEKIRMLCFQFWQNYYITNKFSFRISTLTVWNMTMGSSFYKKNDSFVL